MPVEGPPYVIDPNRIRAEGADELEAIAMSLRIDDGGVSIEVRTGSVTKRTIDIPYADITKVHSTEELVHALVFETADSRYTVTNVTANDEEMTRLVGYIRRGVERASAPSGRGTTREPAADGRGGATPSASTGTVDTADADNAAGSDDTADQLQKWAELHEQGIIDDQEFEEKKRELL